MKRQIATIAALIALCLTTIPTVAGAASKGGHGKHQQSHSSSAGGKKHVPKVTHFPVNYSGKLTGKIIYFKYFAGMEPDFDILSRVVMEGKITPKSAKYPPMTLILDSYIENFQPETQPVLPDLIHPNKRLSYQLGGFFSGQALILGPGKKVLYNGGLYVEALISQACLSQSPTCNKGTEANHMLLHFMVGQGAAKGGTMELRSYFTLKKQGTINGSVYGKLTMPERANKLLDSGSGHLSAKEVLTKFQVNKPPQRGTAGNGSSGSGYCLHVGGKKHCTGNGNKGTCQEPGHCSGSGGGANHPPTTPTATTSSRPVWMAPLGGSLIGLAFILLIVFFWQQRKENRSRNPIGSP